MHEQHFWKNLCSVIDMGKLAGLDLFHRIGKREEIIACLTKTFVTRNLLVTIKMRLPDDDLENRNDFTP